MKKRIRKGYMLAYIKTQIDSLLENKKMGTALNYKHTLNSFSTFLDGKDILFSACNEALIMKYEAWLQGRKIYRNTISFYMRVLRSVYNKAANLSLAKQTYPFKNVYTGVDHTRKRAISEQDIIQLQQLELNGSPGLALARDIFTFSYATRGMAFIDIAFLSKRDITNETITYIRRKTGQKLIIRIEPCIERIIGRYLNASDNSPYIFPFLNSTDLKQAYTQYQTALRYYNKQLKKLGELIGLKTPLSSYTSRHTWATAARNHNIPLSVISAGMGHSSEKTTQIYLASLEASVIDKANHKILEHLNL